MGSRALGGMRPLGVDDIEDMLSAIEELRGLESESGPLAVAGIGDIDAWLGQASRGIVLGAPELREIGRTLLSLGELAQQVDVGAERAPKLHRIAARIQVDAAVGRDLSESFDATGQISGSRYPDIGDLRAQIATLHEHVRRTLETLVRGDTLGDLLQDTFVTLRNERYVIPVKAHAKNWDLGIVHGTSGSGRTVYIEPKEVVALNNQLRIAEGDPEG